MSTSTSSAATRRRVQARDVGLINRLMSIVVDTQFVAEYAATQPSLPLVANLRCGLWYAPKYDAHAYFKSTDGHCGQWKLSLRRLNLHLIPLIEERGAIILVDSTRKGRALPDAFSRTIPIWCCCINRAASLLKQQQQRDDRSASDASSVAADSSASASASDWSDLFVPPFVVSENERQQILQIIPDRVDALIDSSVDLSCLKALTKPLRPLWITTSSTFCDDPDLRPDMAAMPFHPIICVSASLPTPTTRRMQSPSHTVVQRLQTAASTNTASTQEADAVTQTDADADLGSSFSYVQGAADDEESWAKGLTPELMYSNLARLLACPTDQACYAMIGRLVRASEAMTPSDPSSKNAQPAKPTFNWIGRTGLAVGGRRSGRPPSCWETFDAVVNVSDVEYPDMACTKPAGRHYYFHRIPEGKRHGTEMDQHLPQMLVTIGQHLDQGHRILIHCAQGKDRSVTVAVAALCVFYTAEARRLPLTDVLAGPTTNIQKDDILVRLNWVMASRPEAQPSRHNMKRLNRFFMDAMQTPWLERMRHVVRHDDES